MRKLVSFILSLCLVFSSILVLTPKNDAYAAGSASIKWSTAKLSKNANYLSNIVYGNGTYLATGNGLFRSKNGVSWSQVNVSDSLYNLTYGNGKFLGFGFESGVMYSSDGVKWTSTKSKNFIRHVFYLNNKYIATEYNSVCTSTNGKTWTTVNVKNTSGFDDICYAKGKYVSVTGYDYGDIRYSSNFTTWSKASIQGNVRTELYGNVSTDLYSNFRSIAYGSNKYVAVGQWYDYRLTKAPKAIVAYSSDGVKWTAAEIQNVKGLYSVAYGNNKFVAVGNDGAVLSSTDGVKWTKENVKVSGSLYKVIYAKNQFMAVGNTGILVTGTFAAAKTTKKVTAPVKKATVTTKKK